MALWLYSLGQMRRLLHLFFLYDHHERHIIKETERKARFSLTHVQYKNNTWCPGINSCNLGEDEGKKRFKVYSTGERDVRRRRKE
jgi:hypothetical protein